MHILIYTINIFIKRRIRLKLIVLLLSKTNKKINMNKKLIWGIAAVVIIVLIYFLQSSVFKKGHPEQDDSTRLANAKIISEAKVLYKKYSLTYYQNDSLCLYGKYALGTDVTILDFDKKEVIHSKTIGYDVSELGGLDQEVLTKLTAWPKNADTYKDYIAILSNKENIKFLEAKEINSKELHAKIDSMLKIDNPLKNFSEMDSAFVKTTVTIEEVVANTFTFHIISIRGEFYETKMTGPRMILLPNGKLKEMTGPCSNEDLDIYSIDDNVYIHTSGGSCGSDDIGYHVIKITPSKVEIIYSDFGFSM